MNQARLSDSLLESGLNPQGYLTIRQVFDDGSSNVLLHEKKNLIVDTGKQLMLTQLYYSYGAGDPLSSAKIGTGGAEDSEGLFLKTPTSNLTNLYTPTLSVPIILTSQNLSVPLITLMANVDNSQANGQYINEAGFFSASGKMFNIKVFPRVLKKSSFAINLEWTISV